MVFDFGIVVTLPVEEAALENRLEGAEERYLPDSPLPFTHGTLEGFNVVVAVPTAQGSVCSALAASDLLRQFQPRRLVLLGIAAGFPDEVRRGDVVIGDPVVGYEYSKVYENSTSQEPRVFDSSLVR
jgi:nucleoside phosphorylase